MNFRRSILVLLSLVILLAAALVAARWYHPADPYARGSRLFPVAPESVVGVELEFGTAIPRAVLVRSGELWRMKEPFPGALCGAAEMAALLDACQGMKILNDLGRRAERLPERAVTLRVPDASWTCRFGERLPMRLSETLAEVDGEWVSLATENLANLPQSAAALRTKVLLPVLPETITALEWRAPGISFTRAVRVSNGNWSVTQPLPFEVTRTAVRPVLEALCVDPLTAYVRPSDTPSADLTELLSSLHSETTLAEYGLDEETAVRVTIYLLGMTDPMTLRIGKADPERAGNVFCLMDRYQSIVSVPAKLRELFSAKGPFVTDYCNVPVLGDLTEPVRLLLRPQGGVISTELARVNGVWTLVLPAPLPADGAVVAAMNRQLFTLTGDLLGTTAPAGDPLCELSLLWDGGRAPVELAFYAGEAVGTRLVFRRDTGRVYRVKTADLPLAMIESDFDYALVDRTVLSLPAANIRCITVRRKHAAMDVTVGHRDGSLAWETDRPRGAYINQAAVDAWLTLFADLRAVRVIRYISASREDLNAYGLDSPELSIVLDLEGEEGLRRVLLVGTPHPVTGNAPLLIQGRPMVYEIDAKTLEILRRMLVEPLGK
ncbi:MAG: DUF4340 domain-containing protein [Kiritimatiellia bacterium]